MWAFPVFPYSILEILFRDRHSKYIYALLHTCDASGQISNEPLSICGLTTRTPMLAQAELKQSAF